MAMLAGESCDDHAAPVLSVAADRIAGLLQLSNVERGVIIGLSVATARRSIFALAS